MNNVTVETMSKVAAKTLYIAVFIIINLVCFYQWINMLSDESVSTGVLLYMSFVLILVDIIAISLWHVMARNVITYNTKNYTKK